MSSYTPELQGILLILRGDFNPIIFSPAWFAAEGLIRKEEAEKAETQIIHQDVVNFNLDWLRIQVTRDTFVAETTQDAYEEVLRDLVVGTFRLLRHTPVKMMGINLQRHYRIEDETQWHNMGHLLTPKEQWDGILDNPGMRSVKMEQGKRSDGYKGKIMIEVQPSSKVIPGIFFLVNDHYTVENIQDSIGCDEMINILDTNWQASIDVSKERIEKLLERLYESASH